MAHTTRYTLIIHGDDGPLSFDVGPDAVVVGRATDNAVCVNHASISRRHCEVRFSPEGVELRDLGSSNGTFVNGERIDRRVLKMNDDIKFGHLKAKLSPDGGGAAADVDELGDRHRPRQV